MLIGGPNLNPSSHIVPNPLSVTGQRGKAHTEEVVIPLLTLFHEGSTWVAIQTLSYR